MYNLTHSDFCSPTTVMAPKGSNKRNDKELGDSKTEKPKAEWIMCNNELVIDLVSGRNKGATGPIMPSMSWDGKTF